MDIDRNVFQNHREEIQKAEAARRQMDSQIQNAKIKIDQVLNYYLSKMQDCGFVKTGNGITFRNVNLSFSFDMVDVLLYVEGESMPASTTIPAVVCSIFYRRTFKEKKILAVIPSGMASWKVPDTDDDWKLFDYNKNPINEKRPMRNWEGIYEQQIIDCVDLMVKLAMDKDLSEYIEQFE